MIHNYVPVYSYNGIITLICKIFSYLLSVFGTKFGKLFLGDKCGVWVRIHAEEFLEKAKKIWGKEYRKDS